MKTSLPLPQDKKLTVVCRVESGCLGPEGKDHVKDFCVFAQKHVETIDSDFVHWVLVPRVDKTLAEMQYKIGDKNLTHDKAAKYPKIFEKDLDLFEEHLHEELAHLVDQYLGN